MTYLKHLKVVVASPNDVQAERDSLPEILEDINQEIAHIFGIHLDFLRYEYDAFPGFHISGPQGLIDEILQIKNCDIFICIFWKKFGTLTKYGTTGTEHEFQQAYEAWKNSEKPHIMMYFNKEKIDPLSMNIEDIEQLKAVALFKKTFPEEGLWWPYEGISDFKTKVRAHIINYIKRKHKLKSFSSRSEQINILPQRQISSVVPELFKGEKEFFVGRHEYINKLIKYKLIEPGSRVSIIGPGGSGKSQLAFKAIRKYTEEEKVFDLVIPIYFDLGILSFEKFLSEFVEKIGLRVNEFERNTDIEDQKNIIKDLLSNKKHPLIYLDNFETISLIVNKQVRVNTKESEQSAERIMDFLNNVIPSKNTSILLTSRERVNNLVNEYPIDLEGLDTEYSKKLFESFVRSMFKNPKGKIKHQIEKLLEKTGGHPLSIEIIAKNIRTIEELSHLSRILGPLRENIGEQTERFKTLEACFGYIKNILNTNLQELLPKLTFFKSPFPISVAVNIFHTEEDNILDLYERSLLTRIESDDIFGKIDDPEYWLYGFHPAVRNYIEAKISTVKNDGTLNSDFSDRFANYYYALLIDTDNSIGKENHVPSLGRFNIIYQGDKSDFERAMEITTNPILRADILRKLAFILTKIGMNASKALQYHMRSLDINRDEINDREREAWDYNNIGVCLQNLGRFDEALEYHKKSLNIFEELNDQAAVAWSYSGLSRIFQSKHRYEEALFYEKKCLAISKEILPKEQQVMDYSNMASVLIDLGRYEEALEHYKESLDIAIELNNNDSIALIYLSIADALRLINQNEEALEYCKKAIVLYKELNNKEALANSYHLMGNLLGDIRKYSDALKYFKKALASYKEQSNILTSVGGYQEENIRSRIEIAGVYSSIGIILNEAGKYNEALEYHKKSLAIDKELNNREALANDYYYMNFVYVYLNKSQDALDCLYKASEILEEVKRDTNYHNPLIDKVNEQISFLQSYDLTHI